MGCQKNIAAQIITGQGHYLLAVKENQRTLHEEIKLFMDEAIAGGWEHTGHSFHREVEADHGRIETRRCWATWDMGWFQDAKDWPGFASIVCVESLREVMGGKTTCERRYYISSHDPRKPATDAKFLAGAVRATAGDREPSTLVSGRVLSRRPQPGSPEARCSESLACTAAMSQLIAGRSGSGSQAP